LPFIRTQSRGAVALRTYARMRRRKPVDWRRYSKQARVARRKLPRYEHPLILTAALSLTFTILGIQILQALGVGMGSGIKDLGSQIIGSLPKTQEGPLVLGEREVVISVAPILEGIPDFTKTNDLQVTGRIPSFAVAADRKIAIALNGTSVGSYPIG